MSWVKIKEGFYLNTQQVKCLRIERNNENLLRFFSPNDHEVSWTLPLRDYDEIKNIGTYLKNEKNKIYGGGEGGEDE